MNASAFDWRTPCARLLSREIGADGLEPAHRVIQTALADEERSGPAADPPPSIPLDAVLHRYAPTALLQWDWLRGIGHAGGGHFDGNAALFAAYLDATGLSRPAWALAAQYRALSIQAGIALPSLRDLIDDPLLPPAAWAGPCLMLALARFPAQRYGEILGYTLAHCRNSAVWFDWLEQRLRQHDLCAAYCRRQRELSARYSATLETIRDARATPASLAAGHALQRYAQRCLIEALTLEPIPAAEIMLRRKLAYAPGHHGHVELQGQTIDHWLATGDLAELKQALRRSPEVCERLFRSVQFGAPMFGVFSDAEQRLLRAWLETDVPAANSTPTLPPQPLVDFDAVDAPETTPSLRELYHRLLNREIYPDSPVHAAAYVDTVLRRTQWLAPLLPGLKRRFDYTPAAFHHRIDAIYHREMARYRPLSGAPRLSREICLWGITQMAPAVLLDGCWLENLASAEAAQDPVISRLLRTFADEAGYGNPEHNHPNVYRRLLHSLNIALPPETDLAFAHSPLLENAAFALPDYLLAIGLYPERYFPEILGLNLAIELSGLGASYMHTIETLRYYGIDATLVQLHLSIDNLADGHAALAREAIVLYLDRYAGDVQQVLWRRIWTGYSSLTIAALPFVMAGCKRYASAWLRSKRSA